MRKVIIDSYYYNSKKLNNRASQLGFNIIYVANLDFYKNEYICVHTLPDNLFDLVDLFDTSKISENNKLLLYFDMELLEKIKNVRDQYLKAAVIVRKVFNDIIDKSGSPYLNHLYTVSQSDDYISSVAGLLHDIIEDTDITALDLLEVGIDKSIVETVFIVTKSKRENVNMTEEERLEAYNKEIDDIIESGNIHALRLKVRDMRNNFNPERLKLLSSEKQEWFNKKYGNNLKKLEKELESRN
jgi:metal dependent phosphohydrolase, HD region